MPLEVQLSDPLRLRLVDLFEAEHEEIRHTPAGRRRRG